MILYSEQSDSGIARLRLSERVKHERRFSVHTATPAISFGGHHLDELLVVDLRAREAIR